MAHGNADRVESWSDPLLIAAILALDGGPLGGIALRGPSGPGRDGWLNVLQSLLPRDAPFRRCPANIDAERLLGGLDLAASLALGSPILQRGLLSEADGGVVIFAMAECLPTGLGAQIANVVDQGAVVIARDSIESHETTTFTMVLLDEGADPDERAPDALLERCAFRIETDKLEVVAHPNHQLGFEAIENARSVLALTIMPPSSVLEALCETAFAFGIGSVRPVLSALRAADCIAALHGRTQANLEDCACAARLILAPRATRLPAPEEVEAAEPNQEANQESEQHQPNPEQPSPPVDPEQGNDQTPPDVTPAPRTQPPADMVIETVKAALPEGLLAALMSGRPLPGRKTRNRDGRGSGDAVNSCKRGRPVSSRRGTLRSGQRLHLIDTLRAAAPWQKLRQKLRQEQARAPVPPQRVLVRPQDVRIRRFVERRETTIIFVVDASGSAAWQRLAEAKGAVQLMLSHAYQTRARVALVAFRNQAAQIVLPPTRSLARARRLLADLAGGGGTPLANGLELALNLAICERKKGRTPRLLLLTDGAANIARDGSFGRPQAQADASAMARQIGAASVSAVHIDTAIRPRPGAHGLATNMGAKYAPLPSPRSHDLAFIAKLAR